MSDLLATAVEALRLAAVDPAAGQALAGAAVADARVARCWHAVCVAERALGVAAIQQSRVDDAVVHLRSAVRSGRRAGERRATGEARMSLASALLLSGRPGHSFHQIGLALAELDGVAAARARTQRAAMLQDLGRLDEASDDLRRALPVLRRAGDVQWATRALSNRGLLHVSRREFTAARSDLLAARSLCREHDLTLPGAIVEHNLGWLESQRGDVPAALGHLSAAEAMLAEEGPVSSYLLADRAELLLSVRLLDEALDTARAAVAADVRAGLGNHLPESELLLSTIALVGGHADAALEAAEAALAGFTRLERRQWVPLARYARVQALVAAGRRVGPGSCRRAADDLEAAGWTVPALEARLLAGRVALERGRRGEARRDLERAARARTVGPADARARAWYAEAMLREADGRRRGTLSALRAGMRVLEDHRATMGATELRAHVTVQRGALARMGLRLALEDSDARRGLWWAESCRATSTLMRRAHPPRDPVLAGLLAELRAAMAGIEESRAGAAPTTGSVRAQVALERRIRDHCRRFPGSPGGAGTRSAGVPALQAALGDAVLVEYVAWDGRLYAFTVGRRRVRLHDLGPEAPVAAQVEHLTFALRRLAAGTRSLRRRAAATPVADAAPAADAVLDHAGRQLDDALLAPLRTSTGDAPLVLIPDGALRGVPWSLLPSCVGRPVSVSPSATLWHAAAQRAGGGDGVVVVAGPGLPGAHDEARAVAEQYPRARTLRGARATAAAVLAALDGVAIAHLSAHGRIRTDNAMFSSLTLADGPFTVYDLERLARAPRHVVLAACDTGRSQVVGGEILGFTAALMSGGTAALVAPVVPVADAETVPVMRAYHEGLRRGRTPAEALADAQACLRGADHRARAAAASFLCLGHGDRAVVPTA